MDNILQFIVIAGVIAFGIFRQYKKEEAQKSKKKPSMPTPEQQFEQEYTLGPQQPYHPVAEPPFKSEKPKQQKIIQKYNFKQTPPISQQAMQQEEGAGGTFSVPLTSFPKSNEAEKEDDTFAIHTQEEAKRAIIWSEILQRKY